ASRGARVVALGPLAPTDRVEPVLGVRPLGPSALRDGLRAASRGDEPLLLVVDAQWREVVRALPHLGPVASRLTRRTGPEVREALRAAAARILRVPAERVAPERALRDLGFDSLQLELLRVAVRDELGVDLPTTALFAHPSLESLARVVEAAG
ncbi:MAG: acyl carrier protein, partial [Myxococcota bacterium]